MRVDWEALTDCIKDGSRVLDLGCGDGALLKQLAKQKNIQGYGLEIDPVKLQACVEAGVNVIEQDLDNGLGNFPTHSFDMVMMTQTLQAVHYPHIILDEMLRVGRECIVSFPNFGHWQCRFYLSIKGKMPVSKFMPYTWYDTPNIHFCTIKDFEALCTKKNIRILNRLVVDPKNNSNFFTRIWPNLFGVTAVYHVTK